MMRLLITCLLLSGCGLRLAQLDRGGTVPLDEHNSPTTAEGTGHRIQASSILHGQTSTFSYDTNLWRFAKLPGVKCDDGIVMLDTGLNSTAFVSIDVVKQHRYPAHLGEPVDFAYIKQVDFGKISITDLLAAIRSDQWQFHVLSIPIYRLRGWALGMALFRQSSYLLFDNSKRQATISFEAFQPSADRKWTCYEMITENYWPKVKLQIAGQTIQMVVDSGGGPKLILNPPQWQMIRNHVEILRHWSDKYPTWGGFQEVDAYKLKRLSIGEIELSNATVWVRRGKMLETPPLIGLGPFGQATLVWDFQRNRFWIGQ
jgi:hypothetical protein